MDVVTLRDFYQSSLGKKVFSQLNKLIQSIWTKEKDLTIVGIGYTLPYLEKFNQENNQIISLQLAQQGVIGCADIQSILIEECAIPLPDQSVDRILCLHSLEFSNYPDKFLEEIWRVLKSSGKILVITPNRRSIWAQMDNSPFGYGQPYTMTQLLRILQKNKFTIVGKNRGLFILPHKLNLWFKLIIDKINSKFLQKFSGIVAVEATKKTHAGIYVVQKKSIPCSAEVTSLS